MRVLVVDDDRTTRFLLRRALTSEFGAAVTEACDGLEALDLLAKARYQLVILDVQMPVMDGLETLRALRGTPDFKALPVVMLTAERNEEIVQQILALGVLDYMTKPLVPARIVERLRRVVRWVQAEADIAAGQGSGEGPDALREDRPLLIVDGQEEFRRFFCDMLASQRTVLQADTGARGFRTCLEAHPGVVFVGADLGVLNGELLVRKIRSTPALRDTYLVAVVAREDEESARAWGYDGRIVRTMVPEAFVRQFERLQSRPSGALAELHSLYPGLRDTLAINAEQVFGMMLGTEVTLREVPPLPPVERVVVSARGTWGSNAAVVLRGGCDMERGRRLASHLLGLDPSMLDDKDVSGVASEVFEAIQARFCSALAAKQVPLQFDPPVVSRVANAAGPLPEGTVGVGLQTAARDVEFWLALESDEGPAAGEAGAEPAPGPGGRA